jgi:hypothetical protein
MADNSAKKRQIWIHKAAASPEFKKGKVDT